MIVFVHTSTVQYKYYSWIYVVQDLLLVQMPRTSANSVIEKIEKTSGLRGLVVQKRIFEYDNPATTTTTTTTTP